MLLYYFLAGLINASYGFHISWLCARLQHLSLMNKACSFIKQSFKYFDHKCTTVTFSRQSTCQWIVLSNSFQVIFYIKNYIILKLLTYKIINSSYIYTTNGVLYIPLSQIKEYRCLKKRDSSKVKSFGKFYRKICVVSCLVLEVSI